MIRNEVSSRAQAEGYETFEEADDFEVGDEPELRTPYELDDEQARASRSEFIEEQPIDKPKKTIQDAPQAGSAPSNADGKGEAAACEPAPSGA